MYINICSFACLFIMSFFSVANAELRLASSKYELADTAYGQLIPSNNQHSWVSVRLLNERVFLSVSDFYDADFDRSQNLSIPYLPILISPKSKSTTQSALLVGLDGKGMWQAFELTKSISGAIQPKAINKMGNITEVLSVNNAHYISGNNLDGYPEIARFDANLKAPLKTVFVSPQKGEVSSLLEVNKKIFTVVNFSDATSELNELSPTGKIVRTTRLQGGASTGTIYKNDSIVVTYRKGKKIFAEKFDLYFRSKWQLELYDVNGVSTKKNQLVELENAVALVSGTQNKLMVMRISESGVVLQISIDKNSGYLIPPSGSYLAMAKGDTVHIRAQARIKDAAIDGGITSIHFIENLN